MTVFLNETAEVASGAVGPAKEDLINAGAAGAAFSYAANRVLVVPLRSSVVRGIVQGGAKAGAVVSLLEVIALEVQGLRTEISSIKSGTCK